MIRIKTPAEIAIIRKGGKLLAQVIKKVAKHVKPGVNILTLEKIAADTIKELGAEPSFKNYEGYPSCICLSVNSEVVHSIPKDYIIKEGDEVSIDCGLKFQGLYTDMAVTVGAGMISLAVQKLINITEKALMLGIKEVAPGKTVGDIGAAIQRYVEAQGFSVVRSLVGHGVGHAVHEEPRIPNYGKPGTGPVLQAGMVLAIEPMVNLGSHEVDFGADGWTVTTIDKLCSAHFEHTVAVTKKGYEILTK